MNRNDLQRLAGTEIREAKTFFKAGEYSGAYYLAGYAVEFALKACFAKTVRRFDFPDKDKAAKIFTHRLESLVSLANLNDELKRARAESLGLRTAWDIVVKWSEESRYREFDRDDAKALIDAVARPQEGVLPWIKRHW